MEVLSPRSPSPTLTSSSASPIPSPPRGFPGLDLINRSKQEDIITCRDPGWVRSKKKKRGSKHSPESKKSGSPDSNNPGGKLDFGSAFYKQLYNSQDKKLEHTNVA